MATSSISTTKIQDHRKKNRPRRMMSSSCRRRTWNHSFLFQCVVLATSNYLLLVPESQALMATSRIIQRQQHHRRRPVRSLWSAIATQQDYVATTTTASSPWMLWWNGTQIGGTDDDRIRNYAKGNTIMIEAPRDDSRTETTLGSSYYRLFQPSASTNSSASETTHLSQIAALLLSSTALRLEQTSRFVRSLGPWYLDQLQSNPVATKSLTAGLIGTAGDAVAQWFTTAVLSASGSSSSNYYSARRGLAVFIDGLLSGPLMHLGYAALERIVPTTTTRGDDDTYDPSRLSASVAAMVHVLADSVILDSFFVGTTILLTGLLEGIPLGVLLGQVRTDYGATLRASWMTSILLCPIQFACFRYLPLRVRVLAVNCIDVIWDAVLSFYAHRSRVVMA